MSKNSKKFPNKAITFLLAILMLINLLPIKSIQAANYANVGDKIQLLTTYRIRSGAGTSYRTLGNAYKNNTLEIKGRVKGSQYNIGNYIDNIWYVVNYKGKNGYIIHDPEHKIIAKTPTKPSPTPKPTPKPSIGNNNQGFIPAKAGDEVTVAATYNIRSSANTKSTVIGSLRNGSSIKVIKSIQGSIHHGGNYWYEFYFNGRLGYLAADAEQLISPKASEDITIDLPYDDNSESTTYTEEEWQQVLASFPVSYHKGLNQLHKKYPAWKFEAEYHDFSLEYAVNLQKSYNGRNLVPSYFGSNYRDMSDSRMYDAGGWYAANWDTIAFVMDPRNWLSEKYIFMFEKMGEVKQIPVSSAKKRLETMFGTNQDLLNMIPAIIQASKDYEVNPVFTGSRIMTETRIGNTISSSAKGTLKISQSTIDALGDPNFKPDLSKTYYNVFNIGAYDGSNPQANGILYAMGYGVSETKKKELLIPWDSQYKAIYGGLQFISASYIGNKQNNNYYMKYNMRWPKEILSKRINHQYMTSAVAPVTEASVQYRANKGAGTLEESFTFLIPVYQDMTTKQYENPGTWYYDYFNSNENLAPGDNVNLSDFQLTEAKKYAQSGDTLKLSAQFWLRSYPNNVAGNGINIISQNEKVEVLERISGKFVSGYSDQWYKVRYGSKLGYIIAYPPAQTIIASKYPRANNDKNTGGVQNPSPTPSKKPSPTPKPSSTAKPSPTPSQSENKYLAGDANRDGKVNIVDVTYIAQYVINKRKLSKEQLLSADANKDGRVNIVDVTYIAQYIIGKRKLN